MNKEQISLSLIAGKKLKQLIINSEYKTQEEFAYNFNVDVRTVGRWINLGIDSLTTICQIADFFNIDVFTILSF